MSVPDTLAALGVNPETGLASADAAVRLKEHGYNEVVEQQGHPVLKFLEKFWGLAAWMLELIMVLSAVLHKFADLAVVGALLGTLLRFRGSRCLQYSVTRWSVALL